MIISLLCQCHIKLENYLSSKFYFLVKIENWKKMNKVVFLQQK